MKLRLRLPDFSIRDAMITAMRATLAAMQIARSMLLLARDRIDAAIKPLPV